MSLACLAELVSVTSGAVKSLNKHDSALSSQKLNLFSAGSPFESPRSFSSFSTKSEPLDRLKENARATSKPEGSEVTNSAEDKDDHIPQNRADNEAEDVTVIEIIPCEIVNNSTDNQNSDQDLAKNNNNFQKVSISRKNLHEIISPRENILDPTSKVSNSSQKTGSRSFPTSSSTHGRCFVERHVPNKPKDNFNNKQKIGSESGEESRNLSISTDDQPEIIDVQGKVVAVTSGMSQSSDDSMEDLQTKSGRSSSCGHRQILLGKTEQGLGLKQGALTKGFIDPIKTSFFNDVYISQFGLTERQRSLKEALAKRSENNKPKKKFVQLQIIQRKVPGNDETLKTTAENLAEPVQDNTVITAAAAASAAVAAAQPFLKTQYELETKIQQLLDQISELQQKAGTTDKSVGSENRIMALERQVAELNERRLEHLESLQQQQLQMQAQLLFMTQSRDHDNRGHPVIRRISPTRQPHSSHIPQAVSKKSSAPTRTAFHSHIPVTQSQLIYNPSTLDQPTYNSSMHNQPTYGSSVHNQPTYGSSVQSQTKYNPSSHSKSTFNPAVLSKHHNYLNEVRELQGSHLDTPAPRNRVPKPTPYSLPQEPHKNLGFLEELLASKENMDHDTTYSVKGDYSSPTRLGNDRSNNAKSRRHDQSPVEKARQLITSLSNLEQETAESIWGSREGLNKLYMTDIDTGPAPLDKYLKYPEKAGSPYPKLSHHSKEKKKLLEKLDNFQEAKSLLRHLEVTRETLENNIDQVIRSRRDMHLFSTLLATDPDGATDEQLRIEKLVTKKISALQGDVQREVIRSLAEAESEKLAAQQKLELAAKQKLDLTRSGILKSQAQRSAKLAYSKPNNITVSALTSRSKEIRESTVKPPPKATVIRDEATRVRTYGKPEYLRGRTTIRDPYLHFKNPKKGVAAKSSVTNLNESARSRDGRSRSPPYKQGHEPIIDPMPRQFYFSPTRGYIPLGAGDTAPVSGQLVSMAIPLGAPCMDPGMRRSAVPMTRIHTDPISSTPVTAARNVAMVSFPMEDKGREHERLPMLAKQVLPSLDIDSIKSSSPVSDIRIRSPQQDRGNITFLYNTGNEEEEDSDLNKTLTEESLDLEQSGEGIKLPGYEPKIAEYSGPNFPPHIRQSDRGGGVKSGEVEFAQHLSDVMAEDLRRRDLLENNAVMWLEQELMARILSQVPLQVVEQTVNVSKEESDGSGFDESLLVADVIGQGGMQLFIDAGQPVDNALVQQLVVEVIKEKVAAMMAQRSADTEGDQVRVRNEVDEAMEERDREKVSAGSHRIATPEPTPKASPVPSPKPVRRQLQQPATPPQSPPPDGFRFKQREPEPQELPGPVRQPQTAAKPLQVQTSLESESETSVSLDFSEELRRVADKGQPRELQEKVVICHDVATPPLSPPPVVEEEKPVFLGRQITPTSTPPKIKTPPRVRTPSPKRQEEPPSEEEEEDEVVEQPKPILMSVGVGEDRPMTGETQTLHRPPSPKRPQTPVSTMSEASSSTESSATETMNEFISEGQWLLSYSEGQVVGAVNYEAIRKMMGKSYQPGIDLSTASTLRDTDDLDLDIEGTKSEGEFLYGMTDPEKDPRLEVLAQIQKRPLHVQQIPSGSAPMVLMSSTNRSIGELSIGQVPPSKVAMERAKQNREQGQRGRESPAHSPSSGYDRSKGDNYERYNGRRDRREGRDQQLHRRTPSPQQQGQISRARSPQQGQDSRARSPQQGQGSRARSPQQGQDSRARSPQQGQGSRVRSPQQGHDSRARSPQQGQGSRARSPQQEQRSKTPPYQDQPNGAPAQKRQETLGTRLKGQMQYQPVLSEGRPLTARGRNLPGQKSGRRSSDSRLSQNSDPGIRRSESSIHSEFLSRSADDEPLRQSGNGFLTSSLKSRQSSVKKSVEFDLSGTQRSMRRGPRDSPDFMADPNSSAGPTYTEYSLDESELRRIGDDTNFNMGTYRMSVTIPSAAEGEESELSEVDLSSK